MSIGKKRVRNSKSRINNLFEMDEAKLKKDIKALRDEIEKENNSVKNIYFEMKVYSKKADEFRAARDKANEKSKEMRVNAKKLIDERNEITKKIQELKEKRKKQIDKVKSLSRGMDEKKGERDSLNKTARGKFISLMNGYVDRYDKLLKKEMPLEDEIKLFEKIIEIKDRLIKAHEADSLHKEIMEEYEKTKAVDDEIDAISAKIREFAEQAQKKHEEARIIFTEIDTLRKQGDENHKKLVEVYDEMKPFREKIGAIKENIKKLQTELDPLNEQLREIHKKKEEEEKEENLMEARKKIKASKRIDIRDFRLLLEKGEIDFKKE